ncbi:RluA family pseudouridine synthase [Aureivirga sp. CE67]|uniref:RluA family pseudouridine synthase n=1 Tax=Aureivirga sp. CE67 TaxID=1788983 RepID=UPI0018C9123D|nr:RluA family pseudouridine synthase [Aureivirga sp. CE67]
MQQTFFNYFSTDIQHIEKPALFTYPFYYQPHELSKIASKEVQDYLEKNFNHFFQISDSNPTGIIGKMFGVLIVENAKKELGYLIAFSGKLDNENHHEYFVPPVFDMLKKDSFFLKQEITINQINDTIEEILDNPKFQELKQKLQKIKKQAKEEIEQQKAEVIELRKIRKAKRVEAEKNLNPEEFSKLKEELSKESIATKNKTKWLIIRWEDTIIELEQEVEVFTEKLNALKEERKIRSANLQEQLFRSYQFLDANGKQKDLLDIFSDYSQSIPPAAAGECAAPKLFQQAYLEGLKPIAMAEFWWGASPKSEIKKHKYFYPSCRGKCEPILAHMLQGLHVEENPMLINPAEGKELTSVYEDEHLVVINKPAEFLSVPGKNITDSVASRMKIAYPNATGPLVVHRLDMSTSGLILVAKTEEVYKELQQQFIQRTVQKRYVALLDGIVKKNDGIIDLPLRLDLEDRPRQLVCHEHGKTAKTKFEVISIKDNKTKVYFYPITGRTHQLRMHASHHLGLNAPIVGDDLYGKSENRLHLHAEVLTFTHPISKKEMTVRANAEF